MYMNTFKRKWWFYLCAGLVLCLPGTLAAQRVLADTVDIKIFFPIGTTYIDETYRDNGLRLSQFAERVRHIEQETGLRLSEVSIVSGVSPEGDEDVNEVVTQERALKLVRYLRRLTGMRQTKFLMDFRGIDWKRLTAIVEFSEMPYREEVLHILRNARVPIYGENADEDCIRQLKRLRNGVPYAYMQEHFFAVLRNAGQQLICRYETAENIVVNESPTVGANPYVRPETDEASDAQPSPVGANGIRPETPGDANIADGTAQMVLDEMGADDGGMYSGECNSPLRWWKRIPPFALKTNLLFDVALMPNVELEIPIADRWSVLGEWTFPWWRKKDNSATLQYLNGGIEGRFWLSPWEQDADARLLRGHFFGAFAGGGKYDVGHNSKGYQGTFYLAGLSYGYTMPLSKALNLEFSLGLGLLSAKYTHYRVEDVVKYRIPEEKSRYNWWGPVKGKVGLVWLISPK